MSRRAISIGLITGVIVVAAISLGIVLLTGDDDLDAGDPSELSKQEADLQQDLADLNQEVERELSPCPVSPVNGSVDWESANIFGGSGIGPGPVYPGLGSDEGHFIANSARSNGFYGGKLFWYVDPSYLGPVLIRGRRIDQRGPLRFNRGDPRELRIGRGETVEWEGQPAGSRGVPSGVLIRDAGCYEVQINGKDFSYTVVFSASTN